MLTYAHVCWRKLTYADVCERRDRLFAAVYMLRSDTNATVAIHAFQVRV